MRRRQVKLVGLLAVLGMIGLAAANPPQDAETKSQVPAGLLEAAKALDRAATSGDHSGIDGAIETVHARYQALEKIFENVRIRI
jgi:hypothetical protein